MEVENSGVRSRTRFCLCTGHSLREVRSILDSHYLHRDLALAESAIRKLEKGTNSAN
jgi:hypothetical protein